MPGDKTATQEVMKQVCEYCNCDYCTIREIIKQRSRIPLECSHSGEGHSHCLNLKYIDRTCNDRILLQVKCIEELKWIRSEELRRPLSWDEAGMLWYDEGYADRFRDVWNLGIRDKYFFFKAGTVPQRKDLSKTIELDDLFVEPARAEERELVVA